MSRHHLLVLALLGVAACTRADRPQERKPDADSAAAADSAATATALALTDSSDVRAMGTSPSWRVDVWRTAIRYLPEGSPAFVTFPRVNPEITEDRRVYRTHRDGTPAALELTLTRGRCSGDSTVVRGNWRASLIVDGVTMTGCARVLP